MTRLCTPAESLPCRHAPAASLYTLHVNNYMLQVFELTREQERTKQADASKEKAQYEAYAEQERKVSDCIDSALQATRSVC